MISAVRVCQLDNQNGVGKLLSHRQSNKNLFITQLIFLINLGFDKKSIIWKRYSKSTLLYWYKMIKSKYFYCTLKNTMPRRATQELYKISLFWVKRHKIFNNWNVNKKWISCPIRALVKILLNSPFMWNPKMPATQPPI